MKLKPTDLTANSTMLEKKNYGVGIDSKFKNMSNTKLEIEFHFKIIIK